MRCYTGESGWRSAVDKEVRFRHRKIERPLLNSSTHLHAPWPTMTKQWSSPYQAHPRLSGFLSASLQHPPDTQFRISNGTDIGECDGASISNSRARLCWISRNTYTKSGIRRLDYTRPPSYMDALCLVLFLSFPTEFILDFSFFRGHEYTPLFRSQV